MDFYSNSYMNDAINGYISYPYPNTTMLNRNSYENNNNNNKSGCETSESSRNMELDKALELIKKSIQNEKDDAIFYEILMSQAPSDEDKKIIQSIINDEKKHNLMLKQLYVDLTSDNLPTPMMSRSSNSSSEYLKNLQKALFDELEAVEKYRTIMHAMPDKDKYAKIMEIMTDELRHAHKYNFLLTKNMMK